MILAVGKLLAVHFRPKRKTTLMTTSPVNRPLPRLGLVSNCWKVQLEAGIELDALIAEAERCGLSAIELRQTCLGAYEAGPNCVPNAARLADLPQRFPHIQFNIALSLPCLSGDLSPDDPMFVAGKNAAVALAGQHAPHLRLVDLQTRPEQCTTDAIARAAQNLAELTQSLIAIGGLLSIEHARQSWRWFSAVMTATRQRLGHNANQLRLCFDPCNLLLTEAVPAVEAIVESVTPEEVSMIHIKQRRDGQIQPDVAEGDLDWPSQLNVLVRRGHTVPILFEVAPHADVWRHLNDAKQTYFTEHVHEKSRRNI